ncbi:MAG: hypothetical protein WC796_04125 [Candidatus Pacearchaeota archaeon]|jgi:hypothetical protein
MRARIKKGHSRGVLRVEASGEIKEVLANEDVLNMNREVISVCFRGRESSGIIDFSHEEIEKLYNSIKKKDDLIKGIKTLVDAEKEIDKEIENHKIKRTLKKKRR